MNSLEQLKNQEEVHYDFKNLKSNNFNHHFPFI